MSFCTKLRGYISRFWWAQNGKEKWVDQIKWQELTKSKREGRIGFKELHTMNDALLAKQAWRVLKNLEALWVSVEGEILP